MPSQLVVAVAVELLQQMVVALVELLGVGLLQPHLALLALAQVVTEQAVTHAMEI
jgi:hypothetical protein